MAGPSVLWFRHGLRLHDNPALLEAITNRDQSLMPIFIFDNETAGTKLVGYNRLKFLLESLADLDNQLRALGGQLFIFRGQPVNIFRRLWEELGISLICYEQDCEPIWQNRDSSVSNLCRDIGIRCVEKVSHTLWNPTEVIQANGGIPPLTYQMFLHTVQIMGHPSRPVPDPDWTSIKFVKFPPLLAVELNFSTEIPNPEDFDIYAEYTKSEALLQWKGGEEEALKNLQVRLKIEEEAFKTGFYLPNQAFPDLLGPPTSLSAHLRFGCLSVRKFYWSVHDLFESVQSNSSSHFPGGPHITGQLIWREYFYTMSVQNPNYAQMKDNPICLNIPWSEPKNDLMEKWKLGKTGFPLIDAGMRQLLAEGWLHHTLRNTVATFLTRGALWISWEVGLRHFLKYLLDADWSVCAGNWMWVSSSAFEKLLDSSKCTCPVALARRLDPKGEYIRRYVPELKNLSIAYIHEPWSAPIHIQEEVGCIIGIHYPEPMVDLNFVTNRNANAMKYLRDTLIAQGVPKDGPPHCRPSSNEEIRQFFWLSDEVN